MSDKTFESGSIAPELPESRLYTFIDEAREFALYFLEGQKLIQDLALVHGIRGPGFAYFRDVVLSIQPMIALLKHEEQIGFYVDSEEPWFRLKIETSHSGMSRSVLVPDDFREFPSAMYGIVRLQKLFPNNKAPYQSVLQVEGEPLRAIVNRVLRDSYQVNSAVMISTHSDQSLMLHQLPPLNPQEYDYSLDALRSRRSEIEAEIQALFARGLTGAQELVDAFQSVGFRLLAHREVRFQCSCSRQRMIDGLRLACGNDLDGLFDHGQTELEVTCEYCKSEYRVGRADLGEPGPSAN